MGLNAKSRGHHEPPWVHQAEAVQMNPIFFPVPGFQTNSAKARDSAHLDPPPGPSIPMGKTETRALRVRTTARTCSLLNDQAPQVATSGSQGPGDQRSAGRPLTSGPTLQRFDQ